MEISGECFHLNVADGSIKRCDQDLPTPCYFVSGNDIFSQNGDIYVLGHGSPAGPVQGGAAMASLGALETVKEINPSSNKKVLMTYKMEEAEWSQLLESDFSGMRRKSMDDYIE